MLTPFEPVAQKSLGNLKTWCYLAFGSVCIMPHVLPSGSSKYAIQPTPGTACLGRIIFPPFALTFWTKSSRFGTSMVFTVEGSFSVLFDRPPSMPGSFLGPVEMSQ